jgi:hypothetical protein
VTGQLFLIKLFGARLYSIVTIVMDIAFYREDYIDRFSQRNLEVLFGGGN